MRGRKENCQLSEAIRNLPPGLREIIYKKYLATKMREKKAMGWDEVHGEIEEAPFCGKLSRIVMVMFCRKCDSCGQKDSVTNVIKMEKNTISATPYMTRTTTPKSFRNFTERRRY